MLYCPPTFINFFVSFSISCCQIIIVATPLTKLIGKILNYKLRVAYVIGYGLAKEKPWLCVEAPALCPIEQKGRVSENKTKKTLQNTVRNQQRKPCNKPLDIN